MEKLIKDAFIKYLNNHGVFVDLNEGSNDIRCMLEENLKDIYKLASEKNCEDWLDVFIKIKDEMLDNEELLAVQVGDDVFLYVLPDDKLYLFDNLFRYSYYLSDNFEKNFFDYLKSENEYFTDLIRKEVVKFCSNNSSIRKEIDKYGYEFIFDFIVFHKKEKMDKFKASGFVEHDIEYNPNNIIYENKQGTLYSYY